MSRKKTVSRNGERRDRYEVGSGPVIGVACSNKYLFCVCVCVRERERERESVHV